MNYWPQLTYLSLTLVGLGMAFAKHGECKSGVNNAWGDLFASALIYVLLVQGGFFKGLFA